MGTTKSPSTAQKLFGDFDPKLAELTDNVYLLMSGNVQDSRSEIVVSSRSPP